MMALGRMLQGPGGAIFLAIVALAVALPWLSGAPGPQGAPPAVAYPLGTDLSGRDMLWQLSRAVAGTLLIALTALGGQVVLGTGLGTLFGMIGGALGRAMVWLSGFLHLLSIPLLAILVLLALQVRGDTGSLPLGGATLLAVILAFCGWPRIARDAGRSLLREQGTAHVRAARELGMGPVRLFARHLASATYHPIRHGAVITLLETVLALVLIGFVGMGENVVTLGALLADGVAGFDPALWWLAAWPAVVIVLLIFSLALIAGHVAREVRP